MNKHGHLNVPVSGPANAPANAHAAAAFAHPLLRVPTPASWIALACESRELLLIDHANCEKKAASTALSLMFAYAEDLELTDKMSRLAREELRHYEQVAKLIKTLGFTPRRLAPGRYAERMRRLVATSEPQRELDLMICGAFIEARSCERFGALGTALGTALGDGRSDGRSDGLNDGLNDELNEGLNDGLIDGLNDGLNAPIARLFEALHGAEARHYRVYLDLARRAGRRAGIGLDARIQAFATLEAELIVGEDAVFRFHSGAPSRGRRAGGAEPGAPSRGRRAGGAEPGAASAGATVTPGR